MQIQLLFLSFGVFLALVQCSSGARKTETEDSLPELSWSFLAVESTSSELAEDNDVEKNAASRLETVNDRNDDDSRPMKIDSDVEDAASDEHETVFEQKQFNSNPVRFHSDSDSETEENSIDLTGYTNDNDEQADDRSDDDEWTPAEYQLA